MTAAAVSADERHRLDGLEPDNLLAFLALLGLVRALDAVDAVRDPADRLHTRAAFDLDRPPLRPLVVLARPVSRMELAERAAEGVALLAADHDFGPWSDLNMSGAAARDWLVAAARSAGPRCRARADLLAALVSDGVVKLDKDPTADPVDPTPLCLLFGQGHQHFLDRLATVPRSPAPPPRGRGKRAVTLEAAEVLVEALFSPWHRNDPTFSFRWDPEEDVRYALMAGDPTDPAYKGGTQHGANRLAAVGLAALTVAPTTRGGRPRPSIPGSPDGRSFAWPVWRDPASLAAIRALLTHPDLRNPGALSELGVDHVLEAKRISTGKFMNVTRALPLT